jgi:hypothetical protein
MGDIRVNNSTIIRSYANNRTNYDNSVFPRGMVEPSGETFGQINVSVGTVLTSGATYRIRTVGGITNWGSIGTTISGTAGTEGWIFRANGVAAAGSTPAGTVWRLRISTASNVANSITSVVDTTYYRYTARNSTVYLDIPNVDNASFNTRIHINDPGTGNTVKYVEPGMVVRPTLRYAINGGSSATFSTIVSSIRAHAGYTQNAVVVLQGGGGGGGGSRNQRGGGGGGSGATVMVMLRNIDSSAFINISAGNGGSGGANNGAGGNGVDSVMVYDADVVGSGSPTFYANAGRGAGAPNNVGGGAGATLTDNPTSTWSYFSTSAGGAGGNGNNNNNTNAGNNGASSTGFSVNISTAGAAIRNVNNNLFYQKYTLPGTNQGYSDTNASVNTSYGTSGSNVTKAGGNGISQYFSGGGGAASKYAIGGRNVFTGAVNTAGLFGSGGGGGRGYGLFGEDGQLGAAGGSGFVYFFV